MPNALVIRTAGTNCEQELCRAFAMAEAQVELVHLHRLLERPEEIRRFDLIGFPGGFSYGDDIASGRIFAMHVRRRLYPHLVQAIRAGACVIGICNGFQVLVQAGLLPGPPQGEDWSDEPPTPSVSLDHNAGGRFIDTWTPIEAPDASGCIWTRGLADFDPNLLMLPSAHGEGRFVASDAILNDLESTGSVALRYGKDLNGSLRRIAGICDAGGRVLGLMPHPERYLDWNRHPAWTRLVTGRIPDEPPGLVMFRNACAAARVHARA